jgi:restriction system protein
MLPKQSDIEIPLLKTLEQMGGKGVPREIYPRIRQFFPQLTDADVAETLVSGGNKWTNRIQWVRQRLISRGEMESAGYGVWAITEKGRKRLGIIEGESATPPPPTPINLEELVEEYSGAFHEKVLQKLQDLTPRQFERFANALLEAYGFAEMKVTGKTGDGGIDGHGKLKVGLATMDVAFQCKRWQGMLSRPEIDKFRGAISGEFQQGIFFTTSDFSEPARDASIKKGAVPIVLLNGEAIVQLMMEKGLGVNRRPVETFEDQIESICDQE